MTKCPLGLVYRSMCIRTLKSIWNKQSTKNYVIQSIKRSSGNLKPIVVIDDATKKAECFIANADLTDFELYTDMLLIFISTLLFSIDITKKIFVTVKTLA